MSSKPSPLAASALHGALGRASGYRPRVGTSSASKAAAIHERDRARSNQPNGDTPPPSDIAPVQNSSTQRENSTHSPGARKSSASDAAKRHDAIRAGSQSRVAAGAAQFSDSFGRLAVDVTQTDEHATKNKPSSAKTHSSTYTTSGASKAAAKLAGKAMERSNPAPMVPCFPPVFDISPDPLPPLVLELGSGPSADILRRLADIFPESGSFGGSTGKSRL